MKVGLKNWPCRMLPLSLHHRKHCEVILPSSKFIKEGAEKLPKEGSPRLCVRQFGLNKDYHLYCNNFFLIPFDPMMLCMLQAHECVKPCAKNVFFIAEYGQRKSKVLCLKLPAVKTETFIDFVKYTIKRAISKEARKKAFLIFFTPG
ncbi:hypothetical protein GDO81_008380 [Engystomops pustulosus]|uniref:Uncharacterized protein n=1 Tax=Engystomops pustulosus TaxID=76066 RepID=A0AAV7CGR9_ENGPU|nr:hypothetical protein GDO81_008380 [Engystomops pustulosus]